METNNQGGNSFMWIIVVIIIIVVGYFIWPKGDALPESVTEGYSTSTSTPPVTETKPVASVAPTITNQPTTNRMHTITIETNKGTIVFETYDADAPKAANNFVTLANKGFYNGVIFHRVIPGFMIQGGDPTGTGMGGPGYTFEDELSPNTPSAQEGYKRGVVAMANSGPNTNGSQFFIMHADYPLPHNYTIFGKVVSGMDVVDKIATTKTGAQDRPVEKIEMKKVTVTDKK